MNNSLIDTYQYLVNPKVGAGLIYIAVMAKLNAGKYRKNTLYSIIATALFVIGWISISINLQESFDFNFPLARFLVEVAIAMVILGASVNRTVFDYGSKTGIKSAMFAFMAGWVILNVLYYFYSEATMEQKIQFIIGSVVTLMGVMLNRKGELGKVNKAFGAVLFLVGWALIATVFEKEPIN